MRNCRASTYKVKPCGFPLLFIFMLFRMSTRKNWKGLSFNKKQKRAASHTLLVDNNKRTITLGGGGVTTGLWGS
jgi:hypothetical protein